MNIDTRKIPYGKINYLRLNLNKVITEEILLRKFGYRYLEEVPEGLYSNIKHSLYSLKSRLTQGRRAYDNNPKNKYISRHKPVYENNQRIF